MATKVQMNALRKAALRHYFLHLEFEELPRPVGYCDARNLQKHQHGQATWRRGSRVICQNCKDKFEAEKKKAIKKLVDPVMVEASKNQEAYEEQVRRMDGSMTAQELVALLKGDKR